MNPAQAIEMIGEASRFLAWEKEVLSKSKLYYFTRADGKPITFQVIYETIKEEDDL